MNRHACRIFFGATLLIAGFAQIQAADVNKKTEPAGINTADYRLGPEDVIDVFVWKEPDLSTSVVIRPDGKISLPLANEPSRRRAH